MPSQIVMSDEHFQSILASIHYAPIAAAAGAVVKADIPKFRPKDIGYFNHEH